MSLTKEQYPYSHQLNLPQIIPQPSSFPACVLCYITKEIKVHDPRLLTLNDTEQMIEHTYKLTRYEVGTFVVMLLSVELLLKKQACRDANDMK